jgi:hypothetical protein
LLLENILLDILSGETFTLQQVKETLLGETVKINTTSFYEFFLLFIKEKKNNLPNLGLLSLINVSVIVAEDVITFTKISFCFECSFSVSII